MSDLLTMPVTEPMPPAAAVAARQPPRAGAHGTLRLAVGVTAVLLASIALIATIVALAAAGGVRSWLDFPFTGVPATLGEAGRLFAHNATAMLGIFGLLLIAQLAQHRPSGPTRAQQWLRVAGELLLTGVLSANLLVVGGALGAYGTRMVRAVLPHGPVELAAFAVAIALYLKGRHRPLPVDELVRTGALSLALLALAALLEALVSV